MEKLKEGEIYLKKKVQEQFVDFVKKIEGFVDVSNDQRLWPEWAKLCPGGKLYYLPNYPSYIDLAYDFI